MEEDSGHSLSLCPADLPIDSGYGGARTAPRVQVRLVPG